MKNADFGGVPENRGDLRYEVYFLRGVLGPIIYCVDSFDALTHQRIRNLTSGSMKGQAYINQQSLLHRRP
jgi:hypothetical protein